MSKIPGAMLFATALVAWSGAASAAIEGFRCVPPTIGGAPQSTFVPAGYTSTEAVNHCRALRVPAQIIGGQCEEGASSESGTPSVSVFIDNVPLYGFSLRKIDGVRYCIPWGQTQQRVTVQSFEGCE